MGPVGSLELPRPVTPKSIYHGSFTGREGCHIHWEIPRPHRREVHLSTEVEVHLQWPELPEKLTEGVCVNRSFHRQAICQDVGLAPDCELHGELNPRYSAEEPLETTSPKEPRIEETPCGSDNEPLGSSTNGAGL